MTAHRVAELNGALLDAAVAKALGWPLLEGDTDHGGPLAKLSPSTNWALGGPIIERERIDLEIVDPDDGTWFAWHNPAAAEHYALTSWEGRTPLIAAMRAYVASKFGETVDLGEAL